MPQAAASASSLVRFGVFELDLECGELRKNGRKLKIDHQPLQVLQTLLEKPGRVVTREELQQKLWPSGTFVDFEQGINSTIKRLRQTLDDSAENSRFVETLPRRGYRFIHPLSHTSLAVSPSRLGATPGRIVAPALFTVAIAAIVVIGMNIGRPETPSVTSLAVLPLDNLTGDVEQYLVDGIHDDLITELAQISALKVISRTSVLRYKTKKKPLREIAAELGVEGVLEGAVRRVGERWHITAQLISASDDGHLWAQSYDRELREIAPLPREIARAIARRLRITLSPQEQERLATVQPLDPTAYRAYVKGKYHLAKWTNDALHKAVDSFREALDADPAYAPAWSGLGHAYESLSSWGERAGDEESRADLRRRAKTALLRAVELDPTMRTPHQALGRMKFREWDWKGGAREFERASELDPSHPGFPVYLLTIGEFDAAVVAVRRAAERAPLDYDSQLVAGQTAFLAGHYDDAIIALKRTIDLDRGIHHAHYELAWSYVKKGMYKEAIDECETSLALLRQKQPNAFVAQGCEWVYAVAGRRREALQIAQKLETAPQDDRPFTRLAHVYDALGDRDRALMNLQKAYEEKEGALPNQWYVPMLSDEIKADPRFQDLIRRTGQPWARFPAATHAPEGSKNTRSGGQQ